jgi:glycosyltransferase involved in cell wall biosynthesis
LALWFDMTGVWGWSLPQLTGIQRVVVSVLGELLKLEPDVRLFRFDEARQKLFRLGFDELPSIVTRSSSFISPESIDASIAISGTAERPQDFLSVAHRLGPRSVRHAIDSYRHSRDGLRYVLNAWMPDNPISGTNRAFAEHTTPTARTARTVADPLFKSGDACMSLCLTHNCPGYWQDVTANRPADVPFLQLLHDIGQVTQPQWTPPHWDGFDGWLRDVVKHATRLSTVSRFQQTEILRYLKSAGLPDVAVDVVTLGDDPVLLNADRCALNDRIQTILNEPFVLCVSGFNARKNHSALYQVWRRLSVHLGEECPRLVMVGEAPQTELPAVSQFERDPLTKHRAVMLFDAGDDELAQLYRSCLFTVYPSFYEGWGLPVSESLAFGRYCIASSAASLPEVGGEFVDYIDPFDQMEFFSKALNAIENPDYVRARDQHIQRNYVPRSWADTAKSLMISIAKTRDDVK